jgi:hypothetical protein
MASLAPSTTVTAAAVAVAAAMCIGAFVSITAPPPAVVNGKDEKEEEEAVYKGTNEVRMRRWRRLAIGATSLVWSGVQPLAGELNSPTSS